MKSKGLKRKLAALILVLAEVLGPIPGATKVIEYLIMIAGLLGGAAATHATVAGTLGKAKMLSLASVLSFLVLLAHFVPALAPAVPILAKLSVLLGAAGIGATLKT